MKRKRTRGETKSYTVVPYVPSFIILSFFLLLQLCECIACSFHFFLSLFPPARQMSVKQTTTMMGGRRTLAVYMTKETEREWESTVPTIETERNRKKQKEKARRVTWDLNRRDDFAAKKKDEKREKERGKVIISMTCFSSLPFSSFLVTSCSVSKGENRVI